MRGRLEEAALAVDAADLVFAVGNLNGLLLLFAVSVFRFCCDFHQNNPASPAASAINIGVDVLPVAEAATACRDLQVRIK